MPQRDSVQMRRKAIARRVACLTSIDTANALANAIASGYSQQNIELIDVAHLKQTKQKLRFIKMRGSGNDYIYFDCFDQKIENPESLSVQLSSRRKSVGGDGIVLIEPSDKADASMRMFNADGTQGEVGGNAMRCVAKYLYEEKGVKKTAMRLATGGGLKDLELFVRENVVYSFLVHMGMPKFDPKSVPVLLEGEVVDRKVEIGGNEYAITCLSMGNPHCVIFTDDVDAIELEKVGPLLEHAPIFPRRANISFAAVQDAASIRMRVWERGIGETWACGTGACAVVAAAIKLGCCKQGRDITVTLPGGDMIINWGAEGITMMGDAQKDFEGVIEV